MTWPRVCIAVLVVALPVVAGAQQTFRSGVDVVRVDALVTDGRRPIAGLTAADFELRDNGVVQTIDTASLESMPLSLFLVLDTSGSVAGTGMKHLGDAVDLILKGLRKEDRAALVTFSHRVWLRTPLMSDLDGLRKLMGASDASGGTSLRDAVYAALAISDVQDSRPLLVAFSDGLDTSSWLTDDVVEKAARRSNAVVYGVAVAAMSEYRTITSAHGLVLTLQPRYVDGQTDFLESVADATGGRLLKADAIEKLPATFDGILREFRTRYVITYSPRDVDTPGWHRLQVKVKGRSADIKARAGYQK